MININEEKRIRIVYQLNDLELKTESNSEVIDDIDNDEQSTIINESLSAENMIEVKMLLN